MKEHPNEYRPEIFACSKCGGAVEMIWAYKDGRCLGYETMQHYVVVADWVFHSKCWDKMIEEHPP